MRSLMDEVKGELKAAIGVVSAKVDTLTTWRPELEARVGELVMASSDTVEPVLASAGLAESPAPATTIAKSLGSASVVPIDTSMEVPAPCSTDCAAQAASAINDFLSTDNTAPVTASTDTTQLVTASSGLAEPTAPVPEIEEAPEASSAPASTTNVVVCIESVPDNDAGEHDNSLDDGTIDIIPVLTAAAADEETLDGEPTNGAASTAITSSTGGLVHDFGGDMPESLFLTPCGVIASSTNTPSPAPTTPTRQEEVNNNVVLNMDNTNLDDPGDDRRPSWPPPPLVLTHVLSELQQDKVHWQPWPPPLPMYLQWENQLSCPWSLPVEDDLMLRKFVAHSSRTAVADCLTAPTIRSPVAAMNQSSRLVIAPGTVDHEEQFTHLCASLNVLENILKQPCAEWQEVIWSGLISKDTCTLKIRCIPLFRLLCLDMSSEEAFEWLSEGNHATVQYFSDSVPRCVHEFSFAFFQKEFAWQLEGSENYAADNLKTNGTKVLITWPLPNIYCCNTSAPQSYNGTMDSELVRYYQVSKVPGVQLLRSFAFAVFSGSDITTIQSLQDADRLLFWVLVNLDGEANQHRESQWDTGSCTFALCNSQKRWTTLLRHYHAHLQWSSLQFAGASWIWLVAWIIDGLEFSMGHGQAPFQGGRNAIRVTFSDCIHVSHEYYIAGGNQILVHYYLDSACSDISSYREDYACGFSKIKEVRMPWDPGKSSFKHIIPEAYRCGGEDNGPARSSHISWEAWTVDGLGFSTDCGQAPFQGGRGNIRAIFSDQVHVSCYYYLNHECYFDTGTDCQDNSSKARKVHMPWDPGKLVSSSLLKLRLGDKPSFKEGGMLGPFLAYILMGQYKAVGSAQLHMDTYKYQEKQRKRHPSWIRNGGGEPFPPT